MHGRSENGGFSHATKLMGIVFVILFPLVIIWYYVGFDLLLWIERTNYRTDWERDTKDIDRWVKPVSSRRTYDKLLRSWLVSTPTWARDHKLAHLLIWLWRLGLIAIYLGLGIILY